MANYIIKDGDTLTKIAEENGTTVEAIAKANNITNVNHIVAGDILKLPSANMDSNTPVSAPTLGAAPTKPTYNTTSWLDTEEGKTANQKREEANKAVSGFQFADYTNQGWLNDVLENIKNGKEFSYDLNGDALYQQYKDKYIQQGKMAMQDTMGQAAAMTGGYGNSYAASVGNQAYQSQLNNLNDIIPELYQMAYDKYNQDRQGLYNQYSMLSQDKEMEYGMQMDKYNRLLADRDYADSSYYSGANLYGSELDRTNSAAQQAWQNEFNTWTENNDNAQWAASWEEEQRRDQRDFEEAVRQFNKQQAEKEKTKEKEEDEPDYSDWDAGDWESYFSQIRQSDGKAAAEEELKRMTKKGLIPEKMITYAAIGARGRLGH